MDGSSGSGPRRRRPVAVNRNDVSRDLNSGHDSDQIYGQQTYSSKRHFAVNELFWAGIGVCLILTTVFVHYVSISCTGLSLLPKQFRKSTSNNDPRKFQCKFAQEHLFKLTSNGARVVGSRENEVLAPKFLVGELKKIELILPSIGKKITEIETYQVNEGSFTLGMFGAGHFASVYRNIRSVLFRVHGRQWLRKNGTAGSTDALLINCHYDSVVLSPGAGDNAVSCAVQLEVARALLSRIGKHGDRLPEYDVIFLFNGAEENLLQASHAFITQHKWSKDVRAFINLDSAGSGGREIVFQTGPRHPWLIWEYSRVAPYPFATIFGQDLFQTGIIPSDTDFRIFRDYGSVPGMDIAYISNGYVYHTKYDTADRISPDCLQRAGENLLALVKSLANSKYLVNPDEFTSDSVVFFDVLGVFVIVYPLQWGFFLNLLSAVLVFSYLIKRYVFQLAKPRILFKAAFSLLGCLCFVYFVLFITALIVTFVLHKPLAWYSLQFNIIGIYVFPLLSAFFLYWYLYSKLNVHKEIHGLADQFSNDLLFDATLLIVSGILFFISFSKFGSVFFLCMWTLMPFVGRASFKLFVNTSKVSSSRGVRSQFLFFLLSLGFPILFIMYNLHTIIDLFVPILGRTFALVVPDIFMCLVISVFSFIPLLYLSSWASNSSPKVLRRIGMMFFHCMVAWLIVISLTRHGSAYSDGESTRKQRIILTHVNREFRDDPFRPDLVTRHDSGVWILTLDYLGISESWINPSSPISTDCGGPEPYCGMPYLYPVAWHLTKTVYTQNVAHKLTPLPRLLVDSRTRLNVSAVNMTFSVSGPAHTHVYISVSDDVELVAWSVGDEAKTGERPRFRKVPATAQGTHYFIYYSFGGEAVPETPYKLWAVFSRADEEKKKSRIFRVALAGHYLFGEGTHSDVLLDALQAMPDDKSALQWSSSYSMWTYDLEADALPVVRE